MVTRQGALIIEKDGKITVNGKEVDIKYQFKLPEGSSWGQAYDACFEILLDIFALSKEAAERARQTESTSEEVK